MIISPHVGLENGLGVGMNKLPMNGVVSNVNGLFSNNAIAQPCLVGCPYVQFSLEFSELLSHSSLSWSSTDFTLPLVMVQSLLAVIGGFTVRS